MFVPNFCLLSNSLFLTSLFWISALLRFNYSVAQIPTSHMLTTSLQNRVWVQRVARAAGEEWSHSMLVGFPCSPYGADLILSLVWVLATVCPKWWLALRLKSLLFAHGVKVLVHYSHLDHTPGLSLVSGSQNYHQETKRFIDALVTWCHLWGGEKKVETELQRLKWVVWFFWGGRGAEGRGKPWVVWYCYAYWIISKAAFPQIWLVLIWHCKE